MKPIGLVARDTGPLLPFDLMKEARRLKAELKRVTGNDSAYYSVLARFELGHFNQIAEDAAEESPALANRVLAGLQTELNAQTWAASENGPVDTSGKKKSKLFIQFTSEEAFEEVRDHLRILETPNFYQETLRSFGYEKASDIPTHDAGVKVYRALCIERNRIQLERETVAIASKQVGLERAKELMQVLRDAYETLGAGAFFGCLDKFGCPTIDHAVRSFDLPNILSDLKRIVDERKAFQKER